ncbi:MAG: hypothetical protein INR62_05170 [Rhodospirillales bacterium]|nr:hypothetical protein [Acetobacter sp.]
MRASHPLRNLSRDQGTPAPPPSLAQSRVMLTSIELLDRVAEIECATSLKKSRKVPTEFDGVAVCLANWAAIYGPFASLRILQVAVRALLTPVWLPRGQRPRVGWLMRLWVRYSDRRRRQGLQPSSPTRRSSARIAS